MSSYVPKNILLTGVTGFICSHMLNHILNNYPYYNVIGIDKMSYCSSMKNIQSAMDNNRFKFVKADINDANFIDHLLIEYDIDTIMHFAAYSHVDQSFGNSIIFTQNNVVGTHVLLEVAKKRDIKRFIHVSTDEVYGSNIDSESTEITKLEPTNPYAASKAAAEQLVRAYYHSFKLPVIVTRGNNVYGPNQYPEKLIPKFSLKLARNDKCTIHGSGNQIRSFLHINDVTKAFDCILHKGEVGEIYNIGTDDEYSVLDVTQKLVKMIKPGDKYENWITHVTDRDFNDQRYNISTNKLNNLGWSQKIDFVDGLRETVEWYKNNTDYWDEAELFAVLNV